MSDREKTYKFETQAVRSGHARTQEAEHSEPIFSTSSFVFSSAQEAADRFAGTVSGNIYSRFTNPTVRTFEQRLAAMEGAEQCLATASGMSAILTLCLGLLKSGDHMVVSQSIFGTSVKLFEDFLSRYGITISFIALTDYSAWEAAITNNTRLLFLETPSNPLMEVADIQRLADLAHRHGSLLVVDNCFCTPALQRPMQLGADVIIHSATKYLDGQGRCVGGAVLGSAELLSEDLLPFLRTAGPSMSPFNAWVFLKGLETLPIRMQAHCAQAMHIANWLSEQPQIEQIYYPGLASHPQHALASQQQSGFGGVVSFTITGGRAAAWQCIDAMQLFSMTANLGDTKSTIIHPATTTHHRLNDEQRATSGITDNLIRLSVGLEHIDDLIEDLTRGLQAARR